MKINRFLSAMKENRLTIAVLIFSTALFAFLYHYANGRYEEVALDEKSTYSVYELAKVTAVLSDDSQRSESFENHYVGTQEIEIKITKGSYKGKTLTAYNYLGALYGTHLKEGDSIVVVIMIEEGEISSVTVYEFNRIRPILILLALFLALTVWVGGKKGAQSLVGLVITVVSLIFILIPLLMAGAPTLPAVFAICVYVALFSFTLIDGVSKKMLCAMLGTIFGTGVPVLFGLLFQNLLRVDGMRMGEYIDGLLQLQKAGLGIRLSGLLVGGMIISALGAVMDVAMSIASALQEVTAVNPGLTKKEIWRSGMNIGQDMIGTMTNTLILAFVGSSFLMVMYLYSLNLPFYELVNSTLVATQLLHGIVSSLGMILAVPFTVLIGTFMYGSNVGKKINN